MCEGCIWEMKECYKFQELGYDAGLDFDFFDGEEHCYFFVIDPKTGKFIIPIYESKGVGKKQKWWY